MNAYSATALSRTERRRKDAAQRVIAAATRLFAERGFAETPMAIIAAEADVSVGTLYNLFDSKEALYHELVRSRVAVFRERVNGAIVGPGSPIACLERFLSEKLAVFREEAPFIRLYYQVNAHARMSLRGSLPDEARRIYDEGNDKLAALLERGARESTFVASKNFYRTAVCFQAISTELFLLHVDAPEQHPADEVLEEAKRLILPALLPPRISGHATATKEQRA